MGEYLNFSIKNCFKDFSLTKVGLFDSFKQSGYTARDNFNRMRREVKKIQSEVVTTFGDITIDGNS